jgi:hypothetical protein
MMSTNRGAINESGVIPLPGVRQTWKTVALPSEHGGWGLTLEPVLLGLLLAPSVGGVAIGIGAFVAFLVRTPLKLVGVDVRRHRRLFRTRLALRIAVTEILVAAALVAVAVWRGGWSWLVPIAVAAPLVGTELWFDVRSRGRRLVPELCGAIGICSVAASVVLAGGEDARLGAGASIALAGRAASSIPFVRVQIDRLRHGRGSVVTSDVAQMIGVAIAGLAVIVDDRLAVGGLALACLAVLQLVWIRRPPVAAKILGLRQMALGLAVVATTAAGVSLG